MTENTILQLVHDRLETSERAAAELHLDACPDCLRAMAEAAKYMFQDGSKPVTLPRHAPSMLSPGQHVSRYILEEVLGSGGMGVVYRAYDPKLDRKVALKLLHAVENDDPTSRARLLREAQAMARLSHPNVVTVYDADELDERVFVTMELVEGATLGDWLARAPRTWRDIVTVFIAAGRGLAAAHAAGLVHRDFKPANVLIGADGRPRVTDFGLARADQGALPAPRGSMRIVPTLTQTGTLAGTPAYMAPEQFERQPTDARTDQFSFCVAFFEALYGERPFEGETMLQIADSVKSGVIRARPRATVPSWLDAILVRGLSASPSDRFPSLDALLDELQSHLRPRRSRIAIIAAATVALAAGGIAAVMWPSASATRPAASAVPMSATPAQPAAAAAEPPPAPPPVVEPAPAPVAKAPAKKAATTHTHLKTKPASSAFAADAPISPWSKKH